VAVVLLCLIYSEGSGKTNEFGILLTFRKSILSPVWPSDHIMNVPDICKLCVALLGEIFGK
jgi:hypothetical protein